MGGGEMVISGTDGMDALVVVRLVVVGKGVLGVSGMAKVVEEIFGKEVLARLLLFRRRFLLRL